MQLLLSKNFEGEYYYVRNGDLVFSDRAPIDPPTANASFKATWDNIRELHGGKTYTREEVQRAYQSVIAAPFCVANILYGYQKVASFTACTADAVTPPKGYEAPEQAGDGSPAPLAPAEVRLKRYQEEYGPPMALMCMCDGPK